MPGLDVSGNAARRLQFDGCTQCPRCKKKVPSDEFDAHKTQCPARQQEGAPEQDELELEAQRQLQEAPGDQQPTLESRVQFGMTFYYTVTGGDGPRDHAVAAGRKAGHDFFLCHETLREKPDGEKVTRRAFG